MTGAATLILIRHGETAWNAEQRIQGQLDIPLSATGVWQAGRLADRLAREAPSGPIDAIVASDLARAQLTANPLAARLGVPVQLDPRLRERAFGIFEGHTLADVAARWPQEFAAWRERDPDWAIPDGESLRQLGERVSEALFELAERFAGRTLAVVAHGGVLDVAYRRAKGLAWQVPREHAIQNAAINRVRASALPPALAVLDWGDVAHLARSQDERLI